jgi:hypothetical protein
MIFSTGIEVALSIFDKIIVSSMSLCIMLARFLPLESRKNTICQIIHNDISNFYEKKRTKQKKKNKYDVTEILLTGFPISF